MRKITLSIFLLFLTFSAAQAQAPKVKFYPYGDLVLCKGCGHARSDYWRLKFRLENISGKDLVVYGRKYGDSDFNFMNQIQYKNPHLCEWQYGSGESERRVSWKEMSKDERVPVVLKAGQYLESENGIGGFYYLDATPTRFTTFIAADAESEPLEYFSEPYIGLVGDRPLANEKPQYKIVDDTCVPQCAISIDQSPNVRGIRLGLRLSEFQRQFPKLEINALHQDLANYKTSYLFDWKEDAYSINLVFLDDVVQSIEVQFKSLKGSRRRTDFYPLIAHKIGMSSYWQPFRAGWECKDFIVDVVANDDPTITIRTKAYLKVRDMINNEHIKRMK